MLTQQDKIAQMVIVGFEGTSIDSNSALAKTMAEYHLGGVILFDYDCQKQQYGRNIVDSQQLKQLTTDLQAISKQNQKQPELPLFISTDYEGGLVNRLKSTNGFPETYDAATLTELGETATEMQFRQMVETLVTHGINLNFAPSVDLNINPKNPIIAKKKRAFSKDPFTVIAQAKKFIEIFSEAGIIHAIKHFPGHGSSEMDTHLGFVDITETWDPIELEPYRQLLFATDLSVDMVMAGHLFHANLDETYPATLSKKILTDLLRTRLGFEGVIVTDDMQMSAITKHYGEEEAIIKAVQAGCDLLVFGNQLTPEPIEAQAIIEIIDSAVKKGLIDAMQLERSYQRIVNLKKRACSPLM